MGAADVIPGVSGGTVALILGIYQRLVTAISRCDRTLIGLLKERRWLDAMWHLDLPFLLSLATGILTGLVTLGGLMNQLLTEASTRSATLAVLFGLISASAVLVAKMIPADARTAGRGLWLMAGGIAGAVFAFWLTGNDALQVEINLPYVFLCGVIGISAMILPGISGAYLLLILGVYGYLTGILKALPHGGVSGREALTVAVFAAGCLTGLLTFSKLLRWLLERAYAPTMAVLCGFMVGALRKIWPFQIDHTPDASELSHKLFTNVMPLRLDGQVWLCLGCAVAAFAIVIVLDVVSGQTTRKHRASPVGN